MSESTLAHPPRHGAALTKFWLAILLLVAIGVGLAWLGASPMRGETTASGLVFRTIEPGTGPRITPSHHSGPDQTGRSSGSSGSIRT